jgi:plasmid stability protein
MVIRNIPDDVHRALKRQALRHNRSAEAEVRALLAALIEPEQGFGRHLRARWGDTVGDDLVPERDQNPHEPPVLE